MHNFLDQKIKTDFEVIKPFKTETISPILFMVAVALLVLD